MTEYYHIVPWFNTQEWHQVYEKIYSPTASLATEQEALEILLIWKARCPSLPSGVESTLTLLEVYLQDVKNTDDALNQQLLRLAYSSALMRFVNHMLDLETAKGTSLYQAAKNLGVPDWIIDLRHDTAHSNNLPSIELLREACIFSLDWLQKQYWDKQKQYIKDYVAGQRETNSNDENKITALVNFCVSLSICASPKNKIKNLSEITDVDMRESIVTDARDLFGDQIDLSNLKTVSVMGLINLLYAQSKKLLKTKDASMYVAKALLSGESLFLSLELLNHVSNGDFYTKNKLCRNYVQCFEVLLTFLHSNDLILDFLLELIRISESSDCDHQKSKLSALWVSEILKALKRSKQFIDKVYNVGQEVVSSKKKKELKLLFCHWFPNEKNTSLLLDLQKPIPYELTNINFVQPIISAYNPNLTYFVRDVLSLVDPDLPKSTQEKICMLAKLISSPESFPSRSLNICTVEDLKKAEDTTQKVEDDIDSDSDVICETDSKNQDKVNEPNNSIWKKASTEHNWSSYPIGILPWQQNINCLIDMEF